MASRPYDGTVRAEEELHRAYYEVQGPMHVAQGAISFARSLLTQAAMDADIVHTPGWQDAANMWLDEYGRDWLREGRQPPSREEIGGA